MMVTAMKGLKIHDLHIKKIKVHFTVIDPFTAVATEWRFDVMTSIVYTLNEKLLNDRYNNYFKAKGLISECYTLQPHSY